MNDSYHSRLEREIAELYAFIEFLDGSGVQFDMPNGTVSLRELLRKLRKISNSPFVAPWDAPGAGADD